MLGKSGFWKDHGKEREAKEKGKFFACHAFWELLASAHTRNPRWNQGFLSVLFVPPDLLLFTFGIGTFFGETRE